MSRGVKTIVSVAAAVAVPYVAPAIASSIGLSGAIGSVAGSAVVGAGLGAASSAVLGGDVRRGAIMGGIGGGISGYGYTPPTPTGTVPGQAPFSVPTTETAGLSNEFMKTYDPIQAFNEQMNWTGPGAQGLTQTDLSKLGTTGAEIGAGAGAGTGAGGFINPNAPTFGAPIETFSPYPEVTGTNLPPAVGTSPTGGFINPNPPSFGTAGGLDMSTVPTSVQTTAGGFINPNAPSLGAPSEMFPLTGPATNAVTQLPPGVDLSTAARGAGGKTFFEALQGVPGEIAAKFKDPKALADLTLRAAGQLAGSLAAGDGLSNEERTLLAQQTEELRTLQKTNANLFQQRLEQAQNLIGEGKYFDPEHFGLQRARRAQLAGATAKRAGLRGLEGAARAAESRRYDLATARDVGTSFDQGYLTGVQGRLGTTSAGMSMMPTDYPSTQAAYANLRAAYGAAETRAGERAKRFGEMYGSLFGIPQAQSQGK